MKRFSSIVPVLLVLITVLLIFYRGIFNFYFQDDFIHLTLGQVSSVSDFLKLFRPIEHFPYRPVAIQLLSFVAVHVFRLDPFPSHALLFLLHGINIVLLWRVLGEIFGHRLAKFSVVFLYGASSIHFMLLYWWSILFMSLGTTFFLLCFLILSNCHSGLFFFLFFLMLITNEALFVFPFWLAVYAYLFKKNHVKRLIIPSFIFSGLFIFLRIYLAKYPLSSDYRIGNLLEFVRTSKWYFLRALNLPEGIRMMDDFKQKAVFFIFTVVWGLIILVFLRNFKHLKRQNLTQFLFGIFWYFIFASPFFFLPGHMSPYYLNTALIGFFIAVVSVCFSLQDFALIISILMLYTLLSYINADFLHKTHWVVWREEIAKRYIEKAKEKYPELPKGATLILQETKTSPSEISVALSGDKALRLYYRDPSLQVVFGDDKSDIEIEDFYIISD